MKLIYFIIFSIIIFSNNLVLYAYDEEDVNYFLQNSKCHQCDLSNYNFENKINVNLQNIRYHIKTINKNMKNVSTKNTWVDKNLNILIYTVNNYHI